MLTTTSPDRPRSPLRPGRRRRRRIAAGHGFRRFRRIVMAAAVIALIPALVSYIGAMLKRSDSSLSIRTVEWIRDNGARGIVNSVENLYYTLTAPSKGGSALHRLPKQAGVSVHGTGASHEVHYYRPPNIAPIIHPALPGEGVWHATFAQGSPRPPVLITSYRPEPADRKSTRLNSS